MGRITRQSLRVFRMADATFLPARDLMKIVPWKDRASLTNILKAKTKIFHNLLPLLFYTIL